MIRVLARVLIRHLASEPFSDLPEGARWQRTRRHSHRSQHCLIYQPYPRHPDVTPHSTPMCSSLPPSIGTLCLWRQCQLLGFPAQLVSKSCSFSPVHLAGLHTSSSALFIYLLSAKIFLLLSADPINKQTQTLSWVFSAFFTSGASPFFLSHQTANFSPPHRYKSEYWHFGILRSLCFVWQWQHCPSSMHVVMDNWVIWLWFGRNVKRDNRNTLQSKNCLICKFKQGSPQRLMI